MLPCLSWALLDSPVLPGPAVSLGFFDDILIPAELLQPNTKLYVLSLSTCCAAAASWEDHGSNHEEQLFVWDFEGNELYMDLDEPIRFRVMDEAFVEAIPVSTAEEKSRILGISQPTEADTIPSVAPYTLVVSGHPPIHLLPLSSSHCSC